MRAEWVDSSSTRHVRPARGTANARGFERASTGPESSRAPREATLHVRGCQPPLIEFEPPESEGPLDVSLLQAQTKTAMVRLASRSQTR